MFIPVFVVGAVSASLGSPEVQVRAAAAALVKPDQKAFVAAKVWLCEAGHEAALFEVVSPHLRHPNEETQSLALWAVSYCGPARIKVIPVLAEIAADAKTPGQNRQSAIGELGWLGAEAWKTAPVLAGCLTDPDPHVRISAALAVFRVTGEADAGVEVLRAIVRRPYDSRVAYVRETAVGSLARFGPKAKPALPDLLKLVDPAAEAWAPDSYALRLAACGTIPAVADNDPAAAAALIRGMAGLADRVAATDWGGIELERRTVAWNSLRNERFAYYRAIAAFGRAAVPGLAKELDPRRSAQVRCYALDVLRTIGAEAADALPAMKAACGHPEEAVQDLAEQAVEEVREAVRRARPAAEPAPPPREVRR